MLTKVDTWRTALKLTADMEAQLSSSTMIDVHALTSGLSFSVIQDLQQTGEPWEAQGCAFLEPPYLRLSNLRVYVCVYKCTNTHVLLAGNRQPASK